jgi:chorismate mutase
MAIQQMKVNNHLLRCINVLGEALEAAYEERDHSGDAG